MSWQKKDGERTITIPEHAVSGRVALCDPSSATPGRLYVEVFADNMSMVSFMDAFGLTADELRFFQSAWQKICGHMMHEEGFEQVEDPEPSPAEPTEG